MGVGVGRGCVGGWGDSTPPYTEGCTGEARAGSGRGFGRGWLEPLGGAWVGSAAGEVGRAPLGALTHCCHQAGSQVPARASPWSPRAGPPPRPACATESGGLTVPCSCAMRLCPSPLPPLPPAPTCPDPPAPPAPTPHHITPHHTPHTPHPRPPPSHPTPHYLAAAIPPYFGWIKWASYLNYTYAASVCALSGGSNLRSGLPMLAHCLPASPLPPTVPARLRMPLPPHPALPAPPLPCSGQQ